MVRSMLRCWARASLGASGLIGLAGCHTAADDAAGGATSSGVATTAALTGVTTGGEDPTRCGPTIPPSPVSGVALGANDCMAFGWAPAGAPSLPFYQPSVDETNIDQIAQAPPALPTTNRYVVYDGWNGAAPLVPVTSWRLDEFTGLALGDPVGGFQRAQVDAYGRSGIQAKGKEVGLWLNSADPMGVSYAGSASLNSGCWYQSGPFARPFATADHQLDISFDAGVAYDGSTGNGHGQAYFQTIFVDQSGDCGEHCAFSYSVGFYSRYPENAQANAVAGDATGTLGAMPLTGSGIDATGWLEKMPDSAGYQLAPFSARRMHFRLTAQHLMTIRAAVIAFSPSFAALSTDPRDYGVSLFNVNGELYDACKDRTHIAPCVPGTVAQLGMSVRDLRATSILPHDATSAPWGGDAGGAIAVFRDASGKIGAFDDIPDTSAQKLITLVTEPPAAGAPRGLVRSLPSADLPHGELAIFYRDARGRVVRAAAQGIGWVTSILDAGAASDPSPLLDAKGVEQVVFRDVAGDVRVLSASETGWASRTVSMIGAAPDAAPSAYVAGCRTYFVFRDEANHVRRVEGEDEIDWTAAAGGADAYSDPMGVVDASGAALVVHRDVVGAVHVLTQDAAGFHDAELSTPTGAPPALGSPRPVVAGDEVHVFYRGVDRRLHALVRRGGAWRYVSLGAIRGALLTDDDPAPYVTSAGTMRVAYRAVDGRLHELYGGPAWVHRDM